jgi:dihydrolipoamide dehydrogenase
MHAEVVLLSIGRKPFTEGLALEKAGLEANKWGRVETTETW